MSTAIVTERTFKALISKVWSAISNRDEMEKWYFKLQEFMPEKGFRFSFTGGPEDGPQYIHLCEITEVIPQKKLVYTWSYQDLPGMSLVTFELTANGDQTFLKLTHTGTESFAANGPDFAVSSFTAGWDYIVNTSLKNYLEQQTENRE